MKKLNKLFGVAAAFVLAVPVLQAQPDNYYRFMGNYDHGIGREVVQSIDLLNPGYVVAGTAFTPAPGNAPGTMVSAYTPAGIPIWSQIYPINNGMPAGNTVADALSIASAAPLGIYGVLANTNFTAPAQSVLFQIGLGGALTGIWTPLGNLRATSVIFDPAINSFVVLGQAPGNNGDLQLIVVNGAGGIVFSNTYDSGPGFRDTPSRLMLDPATGGYVLVGTSQNIITGDQNVFVVRINAGFGLFCSQTIGNPGVNEVGVDVTWGVSTTGVATDIILANQVGARTLPFVIELDAFVCPGFLSSTLLDPAPVNNTATSITTDPLTTNICIAGRNNDINTNGFVVVLNPGFGAITYARYGQPALAGNEDLTDILFDAGANMIVTTGQHQRINPWPGFPTPANEFFVWLPMMNNAGLGMCPDVRPIITTPMCPPVTTYPFQAPFFNSVPVNVFQFGITSIFLNECANPFRIGDDGNEEDGSTAGASIFPNPANNTVSIRYSASVDDQPLLEVTNMLGEVVMTKSLSPADKAADVDVKDLAPGMYFFRVRNGDAELANEKITIQH
jgi:hypothetical protein